MRKLSKVKLAIIESPRFAYEIARDVGMNETRLSRIANGRAVPTRDEAQRLADVLGINVADIATARIA